MQLHLLLNYSSIPLCPLLSHSCHHPFCLTEDFFFAVLPLSALRVLIPGFSHPLFFRRFGFFLLFGDLWQSSRNVWAPPQDGGRGAPICCPCGSPHCAPRSPAPPRVPATGCHLPNPYLVIPPPPPPSAPSSEAPEPPAERCPMPRHPVRPQRITRRTSPSRARRLPEAEACSSSAVTRDAHQPLGA